MKWHYADARGVWHAGTVEQTVDRGGSDVTYYFRSDAGDLHVTSGLALDPTAHAVYGPRPGCPLCEQEAR
jgi:hypothetical protein